MHRHGLEPRTLLYAGSNAAERLPRVQVQVREARRCAYGPKWKRRPGVNLGEISNAEYYPIGHVLVVALMNNQDGMLYCRARQDRVGASTPSLSVDCLPVSSAWLSRALASSSRTSSPRLRNRRAGGPWTDDQGDHQRPMLTGVSFRGHREHQPARPLTRRQAHIGQAGSPIKRRFEDAVPPDPSRSCPHPETQATADAKLPLYLDLSYPASPT